MTPAFARALLAWYDGSRRDLPWRRKRDPYSTWVSEVMLQQTTVEVVAPRFERFLELFPNVAALASAGEEEVLAAWAGLGYYKRARSLHAGARIVQERYGGRVPDEVAELRTIPGVGDYTAGAIASLAYRRRAAAIDGNVGRVVTRLLGEEGVVSNPATRRRLAAAILSWMPSTEPGEFMEALIELGALTCRPRRPLCGSCPVASSCVAHVGGNPERFPTLPPRRATIPVRSLRGIYERRGAILLVKRPETSGLLPGFFELPGGWSPPEIEPVPTLKGIMKRLGFTAIVVGEIIASARHTITHHRIVAEAFSVWAKGEPSHAGVRFVSRQDLTGLCLTTETRKLLGIRRTP